jgi:biotin transport system ATP-binding protein
MENNSNQKEIVFSIRGLKKKFPDGNEVLRGVDLNIHANETTLIAGANGSGKTLLMRMLAGLAEPTEGEILFRGKAYCECKNLIRRSAGLVFQDADAQILGETVEEDMRFGPENLKMPEKEIESRIIETLSALEFSKKKDFIARHLSGGEKRRLAVAGVLTMGCEIIIMDEPFANLDWPGVIQVLKIIMELKKSGKTVIILTHELEKVLAYSDRLVILAEGKIRDSGDSDAVLDRLNPAWGGRDPRKAYRSAGDCTWL